MSSLRFMRRDSSRLRWRGPRPGPIASTVTEHRRSLGTSWPEWSPPSVMARRDSRGGGDIGKRSAGLIRAGGTVVSVVGPPEARPADGLAIDFVVEADRAQLGEVVQRVRDGRLRTNIGNVATLDDAVAALNPTDRVTGKTIIRIRP